MSDKAFDSSTVVEALVPRACGFTGGWHNRLYNGICVICVHLRIVRLILVGSSFARFHR